MITDLINACFFEDISRNDDDEELKRLGKEKFEKEKKLNAEKGKKSSFLKNNWKKITGGTAGVVGAGIAGKLAYNKFSNKSKFSNLMDKSKSFASKNKKKLAIGGGAAAGALGLAVGTKALLKHLRKKKNNG